MFLKSIKIAKYRNFENIVIDFEKNEFPPVFSIASRNGGGKSTLLQFVFTLLHCFVDKDKKQFIRNLLADSETVTTNTPLATFVIEVDGSDHELAFIIAAAENAAESAAKSATANFNLFLDLEETQTKVTDERSKSGKKARFIQFRDEVNNSNRVTALLANDLSMVRSLVQTDLYIEAKRSGDIDSYRTLVNTIFENGDFAVDKTLELEVLLTTLQSQVAALTSELNSQGLDYITHLANENNVLLRQTTLSENHLTTLSNKVYLAAPNSQVFLFLSAADKEKIFTSLSGEYDPYDTYEDVIIKTKKKMNGFSTYDFSSTELILKSFEKAFAADRKIKLQTKQYGTHYDQLAAELNDFFEDKHIAVDENFERVIFSLTTSGQALKPEDLSHGELKKLGLYIWLKYLVEEDAIVLMDEVDIALHPKWQYQISQDLAKWSKNSQFLLATHSPQILSSTYYKNIIKLKNHGDKTTVVRYSKPPLDRDINTTITTVMNAPDLPEALKQLHKDYRKLIDDGKVDSKEAKQLKDEILQHESENSAFFQDI